MASVLGRRISPLRRHRAGAKFQPHRPARVAGHPPAARLDGWIDRRAELWERCDRRLADLPLSAPAPPQDDTRHARHIYSVRLADGASLSRDEPLDALDAQRIGAGVHFIAVHLHPYYRERYGFHRADLPLADRISRQTLSLPLRPKVSDSDQDDVAAALRVALVRGARAASAGDGP